MLKIVTASFLSFFFIIIFIIIIISSIYIYMKKKNLLFSKLLSIRESKNWIRWMTTTWYLCRAILLNDDDDENKLWTLPVTENKNWWYTWMERISVRRKYYMFVWCFLTILYCGYWAAVPHFMVNDGKIEVVFLMCDAKKKVVGVIAIKKKNFVCLFRTQNDDDDDNNYRNKNHLTNS